MSDSPLHIQDIVAKTLNALIARGASISFLGDTFVVEPPNKMADIDKSILTKHRNLVMIMMHRRSGKYFESYLCGLCDGKGGALVWAPRSLDHWFEDIRARRDLTPNDCRKDQERYKLLEIECPLCYPSTPLNVTDDSLLMLKVTETEFENESCFA
jgi:hypothetical protein